MPNTINADICIIGAGSGGLSVAAGAAQLGRKVVLIEEFKMGGDCLNTGCVPSKSLIAAATHAQEMREAAKFGLGAVDPKIDFPAVMKHVEGVIASIAPHDSQQRFEDLGVTVLREHASFTGRRQVKAGPYIVNAKHFVIATGSSPVLPPISGLANARPMTNETVFKNHTLPEHLIVIGGGPIGVELAQAHRRLGAKVTIIEAATILNREDPELVAVIRDCLKNEGISIMENASVDAVLQNLDGIGIAVEGKTVAGTHLLVATGRKPNIADLNLEAAGVKHDKNGVLVDKRLRTSNKRIYAVGDVIGGRQFTHVAGYHAAIIIRNILFKMGAANQDDEAPRVTYTDPELAQVGLTEAEAAERHGKIKTARWNFSENDRAMAERDTTGFVKVVTDKAGKILGASIAGKNAGDLIQPWALAVSNGLKIKAFTSYIAPYPTRGEANKRAAGAWYTDALFSNRTRKLVSFLSMFD